MKCEIEELEKREKEWDTFYKAKRSEMEEFEELHRKFESDTREEAQRIRESVSNVGDPISPHNIAHKKVSRDPMYVLVLFTKPISQLFSYLIRYICPWLAAVKFDFTICHLHY